MPTHLVVIPSPVLDSPASVAEADEPVLVDHSSRWTSPALADDGASALRMESMSKSITVFLCAPVMALVVWVALLPRPSLADEQGTHQATSHRRFDDVEHWTRVFDDPGRDEWQKPDELVRALAIGRGMSVADVGAGTGYLSRRLSAAVGESGAVFSVEVEPNLVTHLRERAEKEKTPNIVPVLASADNPRLPAGTIDLVIFVDAYHHIDDRTHYLEFVKRSLSRGGRVAIVEWKPGRLPVGPREEAHKIPREKLVRELEGAGFKPVGSLDVLPYQYLVMFDR